MQRQKHRGWEHGKRKMPEYLLRLLAYKVKMDVLNKEEDNDIRFKSRRTIDWNEIEEYLKEYIGRCFEIAESAEKIYIGTDFPDEFARSNDRINLKGTKEKAKVNMITAVGELIRIATNKMEYPDYARKHKAKAKYGWYLYDFIRIKKETRSPLEQ